jgi:hypothetical protein
MNDINPLLTQGRIPGETFQLPSAGIFYTNGELEPSVNNGEVHVYPMRAIEEIYIKTPDMLFSGEAIKQIFSSCIPSIKKPLDLLAKDIDFLLICLRMVSFGDQVEVLHTHDCKDAKEHKYNVSINEFIRKVKNLDPNCVNTQYVSILDDKKEIYISPIRYHSVIKMMEITDPDKNLSPEDINDSMTEQLSGLIQKVVIPAQTSGNIESIEIYDKTHIKEWINTLPLPHIRQLNKTIDNISDWGVDTNFNELCFDCKGGIEINTPLNPITFFS